MDISGTLWSARYVLHWIFGARSVHAEELVAHLGNNILCLNIAATVIYFLEICGRRFFSLRCEQVILLPLGSSWVD
jgi:hypothetical protein